MHQREQYGRQNNSDHRFEPWLSICERVNVTFSTHTYFCTRFVNSKSLAINKKSYFILSAHRPVTFVGVFDAPFELADEAIVKRLEDFACFTKISRRGAIYVIAVGIWRLDALILSVCFNCDMLDHISIERLDSRDVVFVNP